MAFARGRRALAIETNPNSEVSPSIGQAVVDDAKRTVSAARGAR